MTSPPAESDALIVAKWCWPALIDTEKYGSSALPHRARMLEEPRNHTLVADAERILIERGHAADYGYKLGEIVLDANDYDGDGVDFHGYAKLATAPLEARLRAMASVVRAQTEART